MFVCLSGEFVVALPQPPPLLSKALLIGVSSSATSCFLSRQGAVPLNSVHAAPLDSEMYLQDASVDLDRLL